AWLEQWTASTRTSALESMSRVLLPQERRIRALVAYAGRPGKCHCGLRERSARPSSRPVTALPSVDAGQCCLGGNATCYHRNSCCPPSRHRQPGVSDSWPPRTNCSSRSLVPLPTVLCSTTFVIPVPTAPTRTQPMLDYRTGRARGTQ